MRDQLAPVGPFFSAATGAAMGSHNRAINAPQLLIKITCFDDFGLQSVQNLVQQAVGIPGVEETVNSFPRTKIVLRQITPWRASSHNPQNTIHYLTPIHRRPTRLRRRWKQIGNQLPLLIAHSMSRHLLALHGIETKFTQT